MLNRVEDMNISFDEILNSSDFHNFLLSHSLALPRNFRLNGNNQCRIIDTANQTNSVLLTFHDIISANKGQPFVRFHWFNGKPPAFFRPAAEYKPLSKAEIKRLAEEQAKRQAWLKEQAQQNARKCHEEFLNVGVPCKFHKYLQTKNVYAYYGVRVATQTITEILMDEEKTRIAKGDLLIPIISLDKQFMSYQRIRADGKKLMSLNGTKLKGMFPIGRWNKQTKKVVLAEGYATGATIHEATNLTVLVCFDIGNMVAVAKELKANYSNIEVILAADFDLDKGQAGLINTLLVAQECGFKFVFPENVKNGSDWNDLAQEAGIDQANDDFYESLAVFENNSVEDVIKSYYHLLNDQNLAKVA